MDLTTYKLLFKSLMPNLPDASALLDRDGRVVDFNGSLKKILETPVSTLKKKPFFHDFIGLQDGTKEIKIDREIKKGNTVSIDEASAKVGDKKLRVLVRVLPLRNFENKDKNQDVIGALVFLRDTSPELILHEAYKKLLKLVESRDTTIETLKERLNNVKDSFRAVFPK